VLEKRLNKVQTELNEVKNRTRQVQMEEARSNFIIFSLDKKKGER
jgi:hypothetical protein